jgi:hypothetical protein
MPKEAPDKSQILYRLTVGMMMASPRPFEAETLEQIIYTISREVHQVINEIPGAIERRHNGLTVTAKCIGDVLAGICDRSVRTEYIPVPPTKDEEQPN